MGLGNLTAGLTVELFVNDFLMAIFFFWWGIELGTMTVGESSKTRARLRFHAGGRGRRRRRSRLHLSDL